MSKSLQALVFSWNFADKLFEARKGETGIPNLLNRYYSKALDDEGQLVRYTAIFNVETESGRKALEKFIHTHPDSNVRIVREIRLMEDTYGQPANSSKWNEWGYVPKRASNDDALAAVAD